MKPEIPLEQLCRMHFHEDWKLESDPLHTAVAEFVDSETDSVRPIIALAQLSLVIASGRANDDNNLIYDVFRCNQMTEPGQANVWLCQVHDALAVELNDRRPLPATALDDLLSAMDRVGLAGPGDDEADVEASGQRFGDLAPVDESVALVGAISRVLAPSASTSQEIRTYLEAVRTAIAAAAARRWPPIARPTT